jgi:hypothetical protein
MTQPVSTVPLDQNVPMNKTLEAIFRGYVRFRVNDQYFNTYIPAQKHRTTITGPVSFEGYHIVKGWRGFFYRIC